MFNRHDHWEHIYKTKSLEEVSWYESTPNTSLSFIREFKIPLDAKIIDIGGGDSLLVDHLLMLGYTDITVLDVSETALERAKKRLGDAENKVKWVVSDVVNFTPKVKYDLWHDRAAFHFLTEEEEIEKYLKIIHKGLKKEGVLVVGTFSEKGPTKCSGINIQQYSEINIVNRLQRYFTKLKCISTDHITPFKTIQNFIFCSFKATA